MAQRKTSKQRVQLLIATEQGFEQKLALNFRFFYQRKQRPAAEWHLLNAGFGRSALLFLGTSKHVDALDEFAEAYSTGRDSPVLSLDLSSPSARIYEDGKVVDDTTNPWVHLGWFDGFGQASRPEEFQSYRWEHLLRTQPKDLHIDHGIGELHFGGRDVLQFRPSPSWGRRRDPHAGATRRAERRQRAIAALLRRHALGGVRAAA